MSQDGNTIPAPPRKNHALRYRRYRQGGQDPLRVFAKGLLPVVTCLVSTTPIRAPIPDCAQIRWRNVPASFPGFPRIPVLSDMKELQRRKKASAPHACRHGPGARPMTILDAIANSLCGSPLADNTVFIRLDFTLEQRLGRPSKGREYIDLRVKAVKDLRYFD